MGQFQKFKAISSFRRLLDDWYVSNFQIQEARNVEDVGFSEHLSTSGNNLAQVTRYIWENHRNVFNTILEKFRKRVPGVENVIAEETQDGRIVLKFKDNSFQDPFVARFVSDGTIKMFAYLVLLNDPVKHPLLCVEEPENYLHPELLPELAEEFREYADKGGQVSSRLIRPTSSMPCNPMNCSGFRKAMAPQPFGKHPKMRPSSLICQWR